MQCVASIVVLFLVFGVVSCELSSNSLLLDTDLAASIKSEFAVGLDSSVPRSTEDMFEVFHRLSHGPELSENLQLDRNGTDDNMEDDYPWMEGNHSDSNESTTEFLGIDSNGCDRGLRKHLEERCDEDYEKVSFEAHDIEDHSMKTEALCCALEDFEKCNLRAFDKANCGGDKAAIRENMKAARLFITVVANVTCSKFRGLCVYYSPAASPIPSIAILASLFIALKLFTL